MEAFKKKIIVYLLWSGIWADVLLSYHIFMLKYHEFEANSLAQRVKTKMEKRGQDRLQASVLSKKAFLKLV